MTTGKLRVLQKELYFLQEPGNIMHIQICDQAHANVLVKIS